MMPDAVAALFEKIGPGVLIVHSAAGILGWLTKIKSENIKAIIAYEPVSYVFPSDDVPASTGSASPPLAVSPSDFAKLTKILFR